jgi:hypothetical protein
MAVLERCARLVKGMEAVANVPILPKLYQRKA